MERIFQKGNFVSHRNMFNESEIYIISGILMDYRYRITGLLDGYEKIVSYEDIDPIRISPQMLEQLGFRKKDERFILDQLSVRRHEEHLWSIHSKGLQTRTFEYIHQLQNLMVRISKENKLSCRKIK